MCRAPQGRPRCAPVPSASGGWGSPPRSVPARAAFTPRLRLRHAGRTTQGDSTAGPRRCRLPPSRSGGRRPLPLRRGSRRAQAPSRPGAAATSPQGHAAGGAPRSPAVGGGAGDAGDAAAPGFRFPRWPPRAGPAPLPSPPGRAGSRAPPQRSPAAGKPRLARPLARPPAPLRAPAPRALTELVLGGRGHVAGW